MLTINNLISFLITRLMLKHVETRHINSLSARIEIMEKEQKY